MARMRTISQVIQHLRSTDPECAVSEWWLRALIKQGKLKCHKAGNKHLIDLDYLEEFLKNPPAEEDTVSAPEYGKLRKIY